MSIAAGPGMSRGWSVWAVLEWVAFGTIWSVILWGLLDRAIRNPRRPR